MLLSEIGIPNAREAEERRNQVEIQQFNSIIEEIKNGVEEAIANNKTEFNISAKEIPQTIRDALRIGGYKINYNSRTGSWDIFWNKAVV